MKRIIGALLACLVATAAFGQAQVGPGNVLGNTTASRAPAADSSVTLILDRALGSTRGALIERGASGWAIIGPSGTNVPLFSQGVGADPAYRAIVGADLPNPSTTTLGGIFSKPQVAGQVLGGIDNSGNPQLATSGTFTATSVNCLTVGRLGTVTPAFNVDCSNASGITGVNITAQASGNGVNITAIGETNVPLIFNGAGTGTINFGTTSTGAINFFRNSFINHDTNPTLTLGSVGGSLAYIATPGTSGMGFRTNATTDQVYVTHTASANRRVTMTGSNGGNPQISTDGGSLAVGVALVGAAAVNGTMAANSIKCNNTGGVALSTDCTAANVAAYTTPTLWASAAVDFNTTNTDYPITVTLPTGFTKYQLASIRIFNSGTTASLTTATYGVWTGAAETGTLLVTSGTVLSAITSNAALTSSALTSPSLALTNFWISSATTTIYFRMKTAQGAAASGTVVLQIIPFP